MQPSPGRALRRSSRANRAYLRGSPCAFDPQMSSNAASTGFKHWRGIATRYDKTARNHLGGLHLASTLMWAYDLAGSTNRP